MSETAVDAVEETTPDPAPRGWIPALDTFLSAAGAVVGAAFGITAAALVALFVVSLVVTGKIGDVVDEDQFQDRVDAINAVYRQGERAREALSKSGTSLTNEAMCADAFHRVGADEERLTRFTKDEQPDTAFAELRKLSFINGCLGRPNSLPATPLPAASQGQ